MEVTKNVKYLPAGTTQYVVDSKDDVINVDTSLGPVTIILPNIRNNGMFGAGKVFTINDNGYAGTNNITIGAIGNTTNGTTSVPITSDNGTAKCCVSDYSEWFIDVQPAAAGGGGTVVLLVETTYAALSALKSSSGLTKGTFYKMTDRADLGLIIQSTSTSDLSVQGSAIFLNPDYQNAILPNYLMSFEGVWNDAIAVIVAGSSVVSWNGIQYVNATGSNGLSNPSIDTTNWTVITKAASPQLYVQETDYVTYDFYNDSIISRSDKRGNVYSGDYIYDFQWGNDSVKNNLISSFAYANCINNRGAITNNTLTSGSDLEINSDFDGIFTANEMGNNAEVRCLGTITVSDCLFSSNIVFQLSQSYSSKSCVSGFSNFDAPLDMSNIAIYDSLVLTIPTAYVYVGIFNLLNNNSASIREIINTPTNHEVSIQPQNAYSYSFEHTAIGSAGANNMVSDAAVTNIIVGRTNGCDSINYRRSGNLNVRTNIVKLA